MAANNDIASLSVDASSLSRTLVTLSTVCHHDQMLAEVQAVATELAHLSDTLEQLNDAVNTNPARYTNAFNEDLMEIRDELAAVFVELRECCSKLQAMTTNTSGVVWFFKKGRVTGFLRHLEALRGTLLVMRTVLRHGKDYGTHQSDRIAESDPHIMHEDRVILESILAQNRSAILDLHNLIASADDSHQALTAPEDPSRAGKHHKRLSESTGIETITIPDVLPPSIGADMARPIASGKDDVAEPLRHTFCKRGVRLGVHMSILDLNAREASEGLKKKWIQEARDKSSSIHADKLPPTFRADDFPTTFHELSKISEVDSTSNIALGLAQSPPQSHTVPSSEFTELSLIDTNTPIRRPSCPSDTPHEHATDSGVEKLGSKLRQVMRKLSRPSLTPSPNLHS